MASHKDYNKELSKSVRNYNNRLNTAKKRIEKQLLNAENKDINTLKLQLELLPQKESIKQIKSKSLTKQDINRNINRLNRFTSDKVKVKIKNNIPVNEYTSKEISISHGVQERKKRQQSKKISAEKKNSGIEKMKTGKEALLEPQSIDEFYQNAEKYHLNLGNALQKMNYRLSDKYAFNKNLQYQVNLLQAMIKNDASIEAINSVLSSDPTSLANATYTSLFIDVETWYIIFIDPSMLEEMENNMIEELEQFDTFDKEYEISEDEYQKLIGYGANYDDDNLQSELFNLLESKYK